MAFVGDDGGRSASELQDHRRRVGDDRPLGELQEEEEGTESVLSDESGRSVGSRSVSSYGRSEGGGAGSSAGGGVGGGRQVLASNGGGPPTSLGERRRLLDEERWAISEEQERLAQVSAALDRHA